MNKKILKVRTPFRALLYSVFFAEMDAFTQQMYQQKAKKSKFTFGSKLKEKLSFLPTKVLQQLLSIVFLSGLFAFLGLGIGKTLPVQAIARFISMSLFVATFLFSFATCMSMLFMSDDVIYYMTMPFSDKSLVKAKLMQFAYNNALLDVPMFVAMFLGAAWAGHYDLSLVLRGAIYVILCCISSKIVLLFLLFVLISKVKFFKNRDRFVKVVSSAMLVVFLLIGVGSQIIGRTVDSSAVNVAYAALSTTTWGFILSNIGNIFTIPGFFISLIFTEQKLLGYLVLAALTLVIAALLYVLIQYTTAKYLLIIRSLQGGNADVKKKALTQSEINQQLLPHSARKSLSYIDKVLVKRTPNLFTNFVLTPLLMPFYILACALVGAAVAAMKDGFSFSKVTTFISSHRHILASVNWNNTELFFAMIGVSFFLLLMNISSVATAEILRDGRNFIYYRSLPLKMQDYLHVKLKRSLLYHGGLISALLVLAVFLVVILFDLPLLTACLVSAYVVALQLSLIIVSLIVGAFTAKFDFDLETELLRQLKGFSRMLVNMGALASIALPLVAITFVSQGFKLLPTGATSNTFLIVTIWQVVYALALLALYFNKVAKYLSRKKI